MNCQYCASDNILFDVPKENRDSDLDYTCHDCYETGSFDRGSCNHPNYEEDRNS